MIGVIFAPRFGRWFRPNRIYVPEQLLWPSSTIEGDMGILIRHSTNEIVTTPVGWTALGLEPGAFDKDSALYTRAYWQRAQVSGARSVPKEPKAYLSHVAVFRNVDSVEAIAAAPVARYILGPAERVAEQPSTVRYVASTWRRNT